MIIATCVAAFTMLSSCMQEVPIVSNEPGNETTNMTLDEQREWVGEQFDAAIAASGVADGWFKSRPTLPWSIAGKDRDGVLNMSFPRDCGSGGRLIVSLLNTSSEDPIAASAKVRAFWESEGWAVSNIRSYESDPYFRADGEDGAQLAFMATTEHMSLEVVTACSVHGTVTNWQYRDAEENEFTEEKGTRSPRSAQGSRVADSRTRARRIPSVSIFGARFTKADSHSPQRETRVEVLRRATDTPSLARDHGLLLWAVPLLRVTATSTERHRCSRPLRNSRWV